MLKDFYKGVYDGNEKNLIKNELPQNAIKFEEDRIEKLVINGFLILSPMLMLMIVCFSFIFSVLSKNCYFFLIFSIVIFFINSVLHEILHGAFFPKKSWEIWRFKGHFFVYSEELLGKRKFIIMCLAPGILLGLLLFMLSFLLAGKVSNEIILSIMVNGILGTCVSCVDVVNAIHAGKQVPQNDCLVFNHGNNTYWKWADK